MLRRDPSGRALLRGSVTAMGSVMVVNGVFAVVVLGALGAEPLRGFDGTALTPLGVVVGPGVTAAGAAYGILAMGLISVYFALGLRNQVAEWVGAIPGVSRTRRSLVELAPVVGILVAAVVLLATDRHRFTASLNALGVLMLPLLAGIFPMLMITAARRRGELVPVAQRDDALGQLARTFQRMAREVGKREARLRHEVDQLRIEIDEARQAQTVADITGSEYFRQLRDRADDLRRTFNDPSGPRIPGPRETGLD